MALLWTDYCFLFLLLLGIFFIIKGFANPLTRQTYQRLLNKPLAVSSGIVLLFFIIIGTLDCIHLKGSRQNIGINGGSISLLDKILAPLDDAYEKTYSSPFALLSFTSEPVVKDGEVKQIYPRLIYPPQQLTEVSSLVLSVLLYSFAISLVITFAIIGIAPFLWLLCYPDPFRLRRGTSPVSKPITQCAKTSRQRYRASSVRTARGSQLSASITLFFCIFFIIASYWLSRYIHIFGTGKIGQDIFYYAIKSIRTGLLIGTLTTLFMLPLAIMFGISAGYFGGVIDDIIQYIYTTLSSIPGVLLITASVLSMETFIANHPDYFTSLDKSADARLFFLCLILGVTSWTSLCRLLRAEALKLREIDYVLAAKALGTPWWRILYKHLLPNVMPIVLITLVLDFSFLVLAEAVLSYVGVGVSPMTISWGNMINSARLELARDPIVWWPMLSAFTMMFILVFSSNLFADAVRDLLDPHQR